MSTPISLSHSSRGKHSHCQEMYRLHYIEKIRPVGTTSALLFGSAIDKACENYMLDRVALSARQIFKDEWKKLQEEEHEKVEFHGNDFDHELLLQSDNELILKDTLYASVSDLVKAGEDQERIAYCNWISMYRKGVMLVNKFIEWVDENVAEVLGCQIPIELEDENGDKVTGLADFVIKIHGYDSPILIDLKTAARYYERGSVKESEQLALYYFFLKEKSYPDMERAAFLVLNKQIKKNRKKTCRVCGAVTTSTHKLCPVGTNKKDRCNGEFDVDITPEVVLQYIHDEIPQEFIEQTIDKFNISVEAIKAGKFEKNLEGCDRYYGRECPYKQFCLTGCMTGLIKKEVKSE